MVKAGDDVGRLYSPRIRRRPTMFAHSSRRPIPSPLFSSPCIPFRERKTWHGLGLDQPIDTDCLITIAQEIRHPRQWHKESAADTENGAHARRERDLQCTIACEPQRNHCRRNDISDCRSARDAHHDCSSTYHDGGRD